MTINVAIDIAKRIKNLKNLIDDYRDQMQDIEDENERKQYEKWIYANSQTATELEAILVDLLVAVDIDNHQ